MAEIIGLIPSVIALTRIIIAGIRHAQPFFRAQSEFEALQVSAFMLVQTLVIFDKSRAARPYLLYL